MQWDIPKNRTVLSLRHRISNYSCFNLIFKSFSFFFFSFVSKENVLKMRKIYQNNRNHRSSTENGVVGHRGHAAHKVVVLDWDLEIENAIIQSTNEFIFSQILFLFFQNSQFLLVTPAKTQIYFVLFFIY